MELSDLVVHKRRQHEKQVFGDAWRAEMEKNEEETHTVVEASHPGEEVPLMEDNPCPADDTSSEGLNADEATDMILNTDDGHWKERSNMCRYCEREAHGASFRVHQARCRIQREQPGDCDCPYCGNWHMTPELLAAHIENTHNNPELVQDTIRECSQCDKVFLNQKYLNNHIDLVHGVESDESDGETRDQHTTTESRGEVVQAIFTEDNPEDDENNCYDEILNEKQAMGVDSNMTQVQPFRLTDDSQIDVRKGKGKKSVGRNSNLDSNGEGFVGEENFECQECGNAFRSTDELYDHYRENHPSAMQDLIRRVLLAHCEPKVEVTDVDNPCSDTDTAVESKKAANVQTTQGKRPNRQLKGPSPAKIRKTSRKVDSGERVGCKLCDKSYPTVRGMKMHMSYAHKSSDKKDIVKENTVAHEEVASDLVKVTDTTVNQETGSVNETNTIVHQDSVETGSVNVTFAIVHHEPVESGPVEGADTTVHQESGLVNETKTIVHQESVESGPVEGTGTMVHQEPVESGPVKGTDKTVHQESGLVNETKTIVHQESVESGSVKVTDTTVHQEPVESGSVKGTDTTVSQESGSANETNTIVHQEHVVTIDLRELGWVEGTDTIVHQESVESGLVNGSFTGSLNEKRFICKSCGEPFFTAGGLRHHSQTHVKDNGRDYHCQLCGEAFFYQTGLNTHMQHAHGPRHSGNTSNECRGDDVTGTSNANNEQREQRTTTNDVTKSSVALSEPTRKTSRQRKKVEPRFWCEKCYRPYVVEFYFNEHRKKCTGNPTFWCPKCKRPYVKASYFNAHIKKCVVEPKKALGENTKSESSGDTTSSSKSTSGNSSESTDSSNETRTASGSSSSSKLASSTELPDDTQHLSEVVPEETHVGATSRESVDRTKSALVLSSSSKIDSAELLGNNKTSYGLISKEIQNDSSRQTLSDETKTLFGSDENRISSKSTSHGSSEVCENGSAESSSEQSREISSSQETDESRSESEPSSSGTTSSGSESDGSETSSDSSKEDAKSAQQPSIIVPNVMRDAPGECIVDEHNLKQNEGGNTADIPQQSQEETEMSLSDSKKPDFNGSAHTRYCEDCGQSGGQTWLGIHARIHHGKVVRNIDPCFQAIVEMSLSKVLKMGGTVEIGHADKPEKRLILKGPGSVEGRQQDKPEESLVMKTGEAVEVGHHDKSEEIPVLKTGGSVEVGHHDKPDEIPVLKTGGSVEVGHHDKPEERLETAQINSTRQEEDSCEEPRDEEDNIPVERAHCDRRDDSNKTDEPDETSKDGRKEIETGYNEIPERNLVQGDLDKEIIRQRNQSEHDDKKVDDTEDNKSSNVEKNEVDQQTKTGEINNQLDPTTEMVYKDSDKVREKENLDHIDEESTKQFPNVQDLLLGPGYTVELASDSLNDSCESQKPKKRIDGGITAKLEGRYVAPNMQYVCALCDESFPPGHLAFFLHAMEEHNGVVQGSIKPLDNPKDSKQKKAKMPKKERKRRKSKESEGNEFSSSDESIEVNQGSKHEGELPAKAAELDVGNKDEEENIVEKCGQGDSENMETSKKFDQCQRDFHTEAQLINHKTATEGKLGCTGKKEEFKCAPCGKVFTSIGLIERHFTSCPSVKTCYLCDMLCRTREEFKKHFETEHIDFLAGKKKPHKLTFPTCDVCDKSFMSKENLKLHQKNVHKEPKRREGQEDNKKTKVQFSSFVDTIYIDDDDYDDFQPEPVQRMPKSVFASAKSKEEEASKEALRTQQVIGNMVEKCQPMLISLHTVVRQPFEELLVKKIRDDPRKDNEERLEALSAIGDIEEKNTGSPSLTPDVRPTSCPNWIVNGDGEEIPLFVEDEAGRMEEVPNVNNATDAQGTNVNGACGTKRSRRLDYEKSSREYYEKVRASILQASADAEKKSNQSRNIKVADNNPTQSMYNARTMSKHQHLGDISPDQYDRTILQYAEKNKREMELPIEDRDYTIVGDNLLQVKNGYILGTTTDRILMHLHTSRKNVDERIAKTCDDKDSDEVKEIDLTGEDSDMEKTIPTEIARETSEEQQRESVELHQVTADNTDEAQSSDFEEMFADVFDNIVGAILDGYVDEAQGVSHPAQIQNRTQDTEVNDAARSIRLDGSTGRWDMIH